MYRQIAAILLFFAFAAQTFDRTVIVLGYHGNTAAYAKNCENKARPQLQCRGKCQMMKKLQEEENKKEQSPERKGENRLEFVFLSKSLTTVLLLSTAMQKDVYPMLTSPKTIDRPRTLLRPPIC